MVVNFNNISFSSLKTNEQKKNIKNISPGNISLSKTLDVISFKSNKLSIITSKVDHTYLPPVTNNAVQELQNNLKVSLLCKQAKKYKFPAVCVRPDSIASAKKELSGSSVKVATVIGFPEAKMEASGADQIVGNVPLKAKLAEIKESNKNGVDELDVVVNVSKVKSRDKTYVLKEIEDTLKASDGRLVKYIIETGLLTDQDKHFITNCIVEVTDKVRKEPGCSNYEVMVKTSTGMVKDVPGATVEDIKLIASIVKGHNIGIKASGGIKDPDSAFEMIKAGADRIGTSTGDRIVRDPDNYKYKDDKYPAEKIVAIYGSSRTRPEGQGAQDYSEAKELGKLLAEKGYGVLTGGSVGTMEAANKGCYENGGHSVGVALNLLDTEQKPNDYLDEFYKYSDFYSRLNKYRDRSSYQVAAPGGIGTMMEIFDMMGMLITNKVKHQHQEQIHLMDKEFYQGLIKWMWDQPVKRGYITPEQMKILNLVDTPQEVVAGIEKGISYDPAGLTAKFNKQA
ncbi:MAG: deoxyribose-phosphate aldolase [Cyanobacteriota bacterium]